MVARIVLIPPDAAMETMLGEARAKQRRATQEASNIFAFK